MQTKDDNKTREECLLNWSFVIKHKFSGWIFNNGAGEKSISNHIICSLGKQTKIEQLKNWHKLNLPISIISPFNFTVTNIPI